MDKFYLFSLERKLWWRKENYGYTSELESARIFTREEAASQLSHPGPKKYEMVDVTDTNLVQKYQDKTLG